MRRLRSSGFSLLEVIVAVAILGISFSVIMSGMSTSLRTVTRVADSQRRIEQARQKLAELDLIATPGPGQQASGIFDDGTTWRIEVSSFIPPDIRFQNRSVVRISLQLAWEGRAGPQTWDVSTYRVLPPQVGAPPPSLPSLMEQLSALQ